MTTQYISRCVHCGAVYTYQASGHGAPEYNHGDYCPGCWKAVCDALATIPKAVEVIWVPTAAYTAQQLKTIEDTNWEKQNEEAKAAAEKNGQFYLPCRRVYAPLFDLNDPDNINHTGETSIAGVTYKWSFWTKRGDATVSTKMERDVATGVLQLWRNCRHGR
jgi:hypothetical protein